MTRWQYRTVWHEIVDEELDKYGRDGWELVAVVAGNLGGATRYYFKRPLPRPRLAQPLSI